jgi:hypothetical protein
MQQTLTVRGETPFGEVMFVMASDVQAAWIATGASLAVAVVSAAVAVYSALKVEKVRNEYSDLVRREDRQIAARRQLDRYREPLRNAANDLHHRIENIGRKGSVHVYLGDPDPRLSDLTLKATLYRFASYWGVVEAIYRDVRQLKFENDTSTRAVSELLTKTGKAFATDSPNRELMMWREEQRAVGELMHVPAGAPGALVRVIGFSTFSQRYDADFARWFEAFARDVQGIKSPDTMQASRLAGIQGSLRALLDALATEAT